VEQQKVVSTNNESQDIFSLSIGKEMAAVNGFIVRGGKLLHKVNLIMKNIGHLSAEEILSAFLEQYYSRALEFPKEIIVPAQPNNVWLIETLTRARILNPSRGRKKHLIAMGEKNAENFLQQHLALWEREEVKAMRALEELQQVLKLPRLPERIEGYDISNIQGVEAVGSMVVTEHGKPNPQQYRKFKMRADGKPNDFAMIKEMLDRRFRHSKETAENAWPKPDLVVVDGGKGQLGVAQQILELMQLDYPLVSLAKRKEEIFVPGRKTSIRLPETSPALHLLQNLRDEAHRFAITYYRRRHKKANIKSKFDELPGIGAITRKKLIKAFGSWRGVKKADETEIAKIVGPAKAKIIMDRSI